MPDPDRTMRGLIVDYGGVLTTPLSDTLGNFAVELDLDEETLGEAIRGLLDGSAASPAPVHALETGELALADFERHLADRLRTRAGADIDPAGLIRRMFSGFSREERMTDIVLRLRKAGVRTALCSNSWGTEDYPRDDFDELFDAVVISGEVGLRKPDAEIFQLTAHKLGLPPEECVFVDDLKHNVRGAVEVGMCGIHHVDVSTTLTGLGAVFGLPLGGN